jgi:hypothetical protein
VTPSAKYRPVWEPRYLIFPKARDLARISVAAGRAEAFIGTCTRTRADRPPTRGQRSTARSPMSQNKPAIRPSACLATEPSRCSSGACCAHAG